VRLRSALTIISVILVNSIFAIAIGIYYSNREISKSVSQDLILVGRLATDMIISSISNMKQDTRYIGGIMDNAYLEGGMEALTSALATQVGLGSNFVSLAVVLPDGRVISAERDNFAYAKPPESQGRSFLEEAPGMGVKIASSSITASGEYVIRCYTRMNGGAVFMSTLRGDYFSQLISTSNFGVYNAGKIFIVDDGGHVIADTNYYMLHTLYASSDDNPGELTELVVRALRSSETESLIVRYRDEYKKHNIAVYTPIIHGRERWALFLTVPVEETPASKMRDIFIIAGLLFLAFGAVAAFFLSGMQVKPYIELDRRNEELALLRDEAEKAGRAKAEFLANMSHEIRTPMNAVIGMTNIGESSSDIARKDYCFGKIKEASTHLLGVINDILDMSKIDAGKLELSPVDFDFEKTLQRVSDVVSFRIAERKLNFVVYIDKDIPNFLRGDDQRLAQVITNLLGNAVKFTPEGGSVYLSAYYRGEHDGRVELRFEIKDTGIGISGEQISKLFVSFQQADSSTSRNFGGTGLGLAISKRIVELMEGRIWVESEIGKGSNFIFTVRFEQAVGDSRKPRLSPDIAWKDLRVLAVDDDPYVREFFVEIAGRLGLACDTASSGEDACAVIRRNGEYDIYFIDWKLPGMDGLELAKDIRKSHKQNPIVIMISSFEFIEFEKEAVEAGVDKFIPKPLFPSAIADIIAECAGLDESSGDKNDKEAIEDFSGFCVLTAEDVEINREIVAALLEPTNLNIEFAINGREAVAMAAAQPKRFDVIFMDVQMPEMDGYEATRRIREFDRETPIIAMTANVFREDIEKCLEAGMNGHIGKPLNGEEVLRALKTYLRPR
jgi:signal transduction histidine kinase/CheY-like chemotaxis protein